MTKKQIDLREEIAKIVPHFSGDEYNEACEVQYMPEGKCACDHDDEVKDLLSLFSSYIDSSKPAKKKLSHGVDMITTVHYNQALNDYHNKLKEGLE